MKTTVELPEDLFRRVKAEAALRGESLKTYIHDALAERLGRAAGEIRERAPGWRKVFGRAPIEEVSAVDAAVANELEVVDPEDWT